MDVLPTKQKAAKGGGEASDRAISKEEIIDAMENYCEDVASANKENNNNSDRKMQGSNLDAKWEFVDWEDKESVSASLFHSYSMEWDKLFMKPDVMKRLKERARGGDLRSSRFRSVIWKLFLEVLPLNMDKWIERTRQNRNKFEELKNKLIVNPRKAVDSVNMTLNNPLSQDEESPWNKFFQDNELRLTIKQDVIRTYPKIEFFQSNQLRNLMVDILFIFAKENVEISYKQGMHELLAPLIFVLHCDHQAFLHACEIESVRDVMQEVMDPAYLEHDAYAMFCQVMETVEPWYLSREYQPFRGSNRSLEIINAAPFSRSQDLNPSNAIVTKLTRIQDYVLKKYDPELHQHLERLEIAPQIYGIRWLRLLFGREFPMQDLLMLWDAIFGDGIGFDLVDYIFVAMLLYIRDVLIASDYTTCLSILMKYPPVADVHYFVVKATWLREPNQHPRPPNYSHQGGTSFMSSNESVNSTSFASTTSKRHGKAQQSQYHQGQKRQGHMLGGFSSFSRKFSRPRTLSVHSSQKNMPKSSSEPMNLQTDESPEEPANPCGSTVSLEDSMFRHTPSASSLARLESSSLRSAQSSPGVHQGSVFPLTPDDVSVASSPSAYSTLPAKSKSKQKKQTKVEIELEERLTHLQGLLNDKNTMCRYCASKLDVHIDRLQQDLSKHDLTTDDEIMVSLAGLKLVRDVLKGTLKFSQTIADDAEEIVINDEYYGDGSEAGGKGTSGAGTPESDIVLGATSSIMSKPRADALFYIDSQDASPVGHNPMPVKSADGHPVELMEYINQIPPELLQHKRKMENVAQVSENKSEESRIRPLDKPETNSSQLTSRIKNIFKSNTTSEAAKSKKRDSLSSAVLTSTVNAEDNFASYNKRPGNEYPDRIYSKHTPLTNAQLEREISSDVNRQRCKSLVENYYQSRTVEPERYPYSRGGNPDVPSRSDKRQGDKDDCRGRERSKSQPVNSVTQAACSGNGEESVNPLYSLKYDQGVDC